VAINYGNKFCKGLCQQADDIGMCMGICSTSEEHAQSCYDAFKSVRESRGESYIPIEYFEAKKQPTVDINDLENEIKSPKM